MNDKHANNNGDIVCGTCFLENENPKEFNGTCEFDTERELRLKEMLQFKGAQRIKSRSLKQAYKKAPD